MARSSLLNPSGLVWFIYVHRPELDKDIKLKGTVNKNVLDVMVWIVEDDRGIQ